MTGGGGPSPEGGVALTNQSPLRQGFAPVDDPSKRCEMILHIGPGGCEQGCIPKTPLAPRALARLVFASPMLPEVTPQKRQPRVIALQRMATVPFGRVQAASDPRQPRLEPLLAVRKPLVLFVQHHAVIGVGDAPSVRVTLGDGFRHPMQRDQRSER
jgi:hypothetical protein